MQRQSPEQGILAWTNTHNNRGEQKYNTYFIAFTVVLQATRSLAIAACNVQTL